MELATVSLCCQHFINCMAFVLYLFDLRWTFSDTQKPPFRQKLWGWWRCSAVLFGFCRMECFRDFQYSSSIALLHVWKGHNCSQRKHCCHAGDAKINVSIAMHGELIFTTRFKFPTTSHWSLHICNIAQNGNAHCIIAICRIRDAWSRGLDYSHIQFPKSIECWWHYYKCCTRHLLSSWKNTSCLNA